MDSAATEMVERWLIMLMIYNADVDVDDDVDDGGGHGLCGHRDGREVADDADDADNLFIMLMLMTM